MSGNSLKIESKPSYNTDIESSKPEEEEERKIERNNVIEISKEEVLTIYETPAHLTSHYRATQSLMASSGFMKLSEKVRSARLRGQ